MNNRTGKLIFGKSTIIPNMSKMDFIQEFNENLEEFEINDNVFENSMPLKNGHIKFWIWFYFKENKLIGLNLENADSGLVNTYQDWSNDRNRRKRESHDKWLIEQFGEPEEEEETVLIVKREWGEATSYIDMKNGEVKLSIVYK
ncbi:hypothetical protein [Enterococcus sp. LJL51]|uniref:hypothetical protein n=1 Tax=Enterococcus sp. LJL51 TaxID=3416656 RepID=UPI003CE8657C